MKALVIGAGRIGSTFDQMKGKKWVNSHIGAYKRNASIKRIGICDKDLVAIKKAAYFWRIKDTFNDLGEALVRFAPDIVSLCTGASHNLKAIEEIVKYKSVKFLWVEKPFSDTLENALIQQKLLADNNIRFITNYQRRFDDFYLYIKNHLHDLVGDVQKCTAYFSGGIVNSGSHLINLLIFYFGIPEKVTPLKLETDTAKNFHGDFQMEFKNVSAYCFELNKQSSILSGGYSIFEIQILGDKGKISINSLPFNEYEYSWHAAGRSRFENINILREKKSKINFKRNYMENGLRHLLCKVDAEKVGDTEEAVETLKVFKKMGII